MTKSEILTAIRQTTVSNGGQPLGSKRFESETGLSRREWQGKFWARWSDALVEAGYSPNQMTSAYDDNFLLQRYANLARELKRLPTSNDLRLKCRMDKSFPQVIERLGNKAKLITLLKAFCESDVTYADVGAMCADYISQKSVALTSKDRSPGGTFGFVYLYKHGTRPEYKIGKTYNILRREGELRVELPERVEPIHTIKTDDPSGVEAYWHRRFDGKRMQGEWFALNADDIRAFKRWTKLF